MFYNEEPMYKNSDSPTPEFDEANDTYLNNNVEDASIPEDGQLPLFAPIPSAAPVPTARRTGAQAPVQSVQPPVQSAFNVQDIVAETLKQQQKPPRKVVEVRIFFDDGTFETFSAH